MVYVPDVDGDGQAASSDQDRELTYVPDPDWECQAASSDESWDVTYDPDGETFDAAF